MKFVFAITTLMFLILPPKDDVKVLQSTIETRTSATGDFKNQVIREFDENGYLIEQVYINAKQLTESISKYTVDGKGRVTADSTYNADDELTEVWLFTYDIHDEIILQERTYIERDAYYEESFRPKYDANGNLLLVMQFDKEGVLDWEYEYTYDEAGNEIKSVSYFQGEIRNQWTKKYKNGLCIEETLFDYDNDELERTENTLYFYEYNKEGQKVKTTIHSVADYLPKEIITVRNFVYDEAGNEVEEREFEDGELYTITTTDNTYW